MSERLIIKVDRYLRRPDTRLARTLHSISSKTGRDYRTSPIKKFAERSAAFPLALAATPVIGALAVGVKLEDRGPVFYKHQRIGKNGVVFDMWKLRTLKNGADSDHNVNVATSINSALPDDPRSTRIGEWLRKYGLDELPQIWHIVSGKMSFVDMRPDSPMAWSLMKVRRQKNANNEDKKSSGDVLYEAAIVAEPGFMNPLSAFYKKGSIDEKYYFNSLYARKASLGLKLYVMFRTLVRPFLENGR